MFERMSTPEGLRLGKLTTLHGVVETPIFMPVGTQGTVKTMAPHELEELGVQILLGNTYHLNLRPGTDVFRSTGGLHRFMAWSRPILTDSGGFQVFSLGKIRAIRENGIAFRSHVDGSPCFLGPKEAMEIQSAMGSDIWMVLDECPPWPCDSVRLREAVERSIRWARECREHKMRLDPENRSQLFGIVQGGSDVELRRECAERLVEIGFDGYAIGGVSVGEPESEMFKAIEATVPFLPINQPRYAMGLGTPRQLIEMVARGVDMFDCVLPTRAARHGGVYTLDGCLQIGAGRFRNDLGPMEEDCGCYACKNFSRAYIRHLLHSKEILGLRLATWHNLHFYLERMRLAREAIREGRFQEYRREFAARSKGSEYEFNTNSKP